MLDDYIHTWGIALKWSLELSTPSMIVKAIPESEDCSVSASLLSVRSGREMAKTSWNYTRYKGVGSQSIVPYTKSVVLNVEQMMVLGHMVV